MRWTLLLLLALSSACSIGKGYVAEPVTANKCVAVTVTDGQMNISVPGVTEITINGSGTYESTLTECAWRQAGFRSGSEHGQNP